MGVPPFLTRRMEYSILNTLVIITMVVIAKPGDGDLHVTMTCTRIWKHPASTTGSGGIQLARPAEWLGMFTTQESGLLDGRSTTEEVFGPHGRLDLM